MLSRTPTHIITIVTSRSHIPVAHKLIDFDDHSTARLKLTNNEVSSRQHLHPQHSAQHLPRAPLQIIVLTN